MFYKIFLFIKYTILLFYRIFLFIKYTILLFYRILLFIKYTILPFIKYKILQFIKYKVLLFIGHIRNKLVAIRGQLKDIYNFIIYDVIYDNIDIIIFHLVLYAIINYFFLKRYMEFLYSLNLEQYKYYFLILYFDFKKKMNLWKMLQVVIHGIKTNNTDGLLPYILFLLCTFSIFLNLIEGIFSKKVEDRDSAVVDVILIIIILILLR